MGDGEGVVSGVESVVFVAFQVPCGPLEKSRVLANMCPTKSGLDVFWWIDGGVKSLIIV